MPVTSEELGSYQEAVNHLKNPLTSFCRNSPYSQDKFQLSGSFDNVLPRKYAFLATFGPVSMIDKGSQSQETRPAAVHLVQGPGLSLLSRRRLFSILDTYFFEKTYLF